MSKAGDRLGRQSLNLCRIGEIANALTEGSRRHQALHSFRECVFLDIGRVNPGSAFKEGTRDGRPDIAGGPSDQNALSPGLIHRIRLAGLRAFRTLIRLNEHIYPMNERANLNGVSLRYSWPDQGVGA